MKSALQASLARLKPYLEKNQIEAYRLYNCEEFPLAIDIYKDKAVIHMFADIPADMIEEIEAELKDLLQITEFFYKDRSGRGAGVPAGESPKVETTVEEYGHKFLLNLSDYLDTGLFLDHRETRHYIESMCKDKIVLNTFAYT